MKKDRQAALEQINWLMDDLQSRRIRAGMRSSMLRGALADCGCNSRKQVSRSGSGFAEKKNGILIRHDGEGGVIGDLQHKKNSR